MHVPGRPAKKSLTLLFWDFELWNDHESYDMKSASSLLSLVNQKVMISNKSLHILFQNFSMRNVKTSNMFSFFNFPE